MPDPILVTIFGIDIRWYGVAIMVGVLAAAYIASVESRRRGENQEHVWGLLPWVLVAGIVGARLGWVLAEAPSAGGRDFWQLLVGSGFEIRGLSIQGGLVGGVLAGLIYCRRQGLSFLTWADIIAPGLALAQAIGRWGNYFNQEAFGRPTTLPWGIPISVERQAAVAGPDAGFTPSPELRFHPTFAYEMIWNVLNFGLLMWLGRQRRIRLFEGDLLWIYLAVYSVGRYFIEAIRVDSATLSGFKTPQLVALATIAGALAILALRHRPGSRARLAARKDNSTSTEESAPAESTQVGAST